MPKSNSRAARVAVALVVAAPFAVGACGSDDNPSAPPDASLSPATAEQLATASDRVADQLESGDVCAAAHRADDLDAAVAAADIPAELRPDIEAAAEQLVDAVNCEVVVETQPTETEEEQKKEEDHPDDSSGPGRGPHDKLPPGQAKKFGGEE